jgi:hypothetical protein
MGSMLVDPLVIPPTGLAHPLVFREAGTQNSSEFFRPRRGVLPLSSGIRGQQATEIRSSLQSASRGVGWSALQNALLLADAPCVQATGSLELGSPVSSRPSPSCFATSLSYTWVITLYQPGVRLEGCLACSGTVTRASAASCERPLH